MKHFCCNNQETERFVSNSHAERSYLVEQGKISCCWSKTDSGITMDVAIPCNTIAEIVLPDDTVKQVGSGRYHFA